MIHDRADDQDQRLQERPRWAKLPQQAALEDFDTRSARGLDQKHVASLCALAFIKDHLNVLIACPCIVGKSFNARTLCHAARSRRLVDEDTKYHAQVNRSAFLKRLAKADLRYIDDFGLASISDQSKRPVGNPSRPLRQNVHAHH